MPENNIYNRIGQGKKSEEMEGESEREDITSKGAVKGWQGEGTHRRAINGEAGQAAWLTGGGAREQENRVHLRVFFFVPLGPVGAVRQRSEGLTEVGSGLSCWTETPGE